MNTGFATDSTSASAFDQMQLEDALDAPEQCGIRLWGVQNYGSIDAETRDEMEESKLLSDYLSRFRRSDTYADETQ